jgi:hypothetical protein
VFARPEHQQLVPQTDEDIPLRIDGGASTGRPALPGRVRGWVPPEKPVQAFRGPGLGCSLFFRPSTFLQPPSLLFCSASLLLHAAGFFFGSCPFLGLATFLRPPSLFFCRASLLFGTAGFFGSCPFFGLASFLGLPSLLFCRASLLVGAAGFFGSCPIFGLASFLGPAGLLVRSALLFLQHPRLLGRCGRGFADLGETFPHRAAFRAAEQHAVHDGPTLVAAEVGHYPAFDTGVYFTDTLALV